ncbi:MAG: muramoyltetrapeptide carboxypeptidase [Patiriisocius sp.]
MLIRNKVPQTQAINLTIGDTIAIVSTARKISEKELEPAILFAKEMGLKVHLGMTIGAEDQQYAGNDVLRAQDLQEALDSLSIQAIWCARGGYGTIRMVDLLDFDQFQKQPKWIIGYSDVTVLHSHINNLGIATIHGQMCLEIEKRSQASRHTLQEALFGNMSSIAYKLENASYGKIGKATGTLIGGNLSVLYSILDSPSEIDWQGKVLFIEDLDEMLYHIDRMMQNLKRSGRLKKLAGLVVGGMSVMRDNSIPFGKTAIEIISETVSEYDYPVCFHFPAGHIEDNRALIFGKEVTLEVRQEQVRLTYV